MLNTTIMKLDNSLLSNPSNPHYFIVKGGFNTITEDSIIVDFKPFPSAKLANKWAKGVGCFAVFASHMAYQSILNYKL